jgi:uncharacterized protein YbjT (DUF2867 family)
MLMEDSMYVVTGATGNTGSVVAKQLLTHGEKVRVIGRSADRLQALASLGAEPLVADLTNAAALAQAFKGAQAVYAMIPPDISNQDARAHQERVSDALASALEKAATQHAVALSSFGADKPERTGPVVGLYNLEQKLNRIAGLNVLYLRAGYFMENTLGQAGIIHALGMTAGPVAADLKLPMIATRDIGTFAADALLKLNFTGKQPQELLGERDLDYNDVTTIIGKSIGKPDLRYVALPDDQVRPALLQMGMSPNMADLILEMSASLNSGYMRALEKRSPQNTTSTSYETFVAEEFVQAYERKSRAA